MIWCILDNTFIGTLSAGLILAGVGLFLYRWQKKIDADYEDKKKIKEVSSLLFINIETAIKYYEGHLNAWNDPKNQWLKNTFNALNQQLGNAVQDKFDRDYLLLSEKISSLSEDLIIRLKIFDEKKYKECINALTEKIPVLNIHLSAGIAVLEKLTEQNINEIKKASRGIKDALEKIIKY